MMAEIARKAKVQKVRICKDGPYLVEGHVPLAKERMVLDEDGTPIDWQVCAHYPEQEAYALCRCGGSHTKPYCDGTHVKIKFEGKETANRGSHKDRAEVYEGPQLDLADAEELCAHLRFCHRAGGEWKLIERSDDPEAKRVAIEVANKCASGRLVACEKGTGEPIEHRTTPSISVIQDPGKGVSGPLSVKGGIHVESSKGDVYEPRNRVTLCRCGSSGNKPFCDGTHISIRFNDGDENP